MVSAPRRAIRGAPLRAYSGCMEARATATAWFKIEQETVYAVALIAVCVLLASVALAWWSSVSVGQWKRSEEGLTRQNGRTSLMTS